MGRKSEGHKIRGGGLTLGPVEENTAWRCTGEGCGLDEVGEVV